VKNFISEKHPPPDYENTTTEDLVNILQKSLAVLEQAKIFEKFQEKSKKTDWLCLMTQLCPKLSVSNL